MSNFSLQFARDCVSKGFIWWVGLSFLFGGGEGFFYSFFLGTWGGGEREREREALCWIYTEVVIGI
jgi:hypothetical protein